MKPSTIMELAESSPETLLRELVWAKAFVEAAERALKTKMAKDGVKKIGNGPSMKLIKKTIKTLSSSKAASVLEDAGYDVLQLADVRLTEDGIKAALGVTEGNRVISILKEAGCYNEREIEYFGVKA